MGPKKRNCKAVMKLLSVTTTLLVVVVLVLAARAPSVEAAEGGILDSVLGLVGLGGGNDGVSEEEAAAAAAAAAEKAARLAQHPNAIPEVSAERMAELKAEFPPARGLGEEVHPMLDLRS